MIASSSQTVQPFLASDVFGMILILNAVVYLLLWRRDRDPGMGWFALSWALLAPWMASSPSQNLSGLYIVWTPWWIVLYISLVCLSKGLIDYLNLPPLQRPRALWFTQAPLALFMAVMLYVGLFDAQVLRPVSALLLAVWYLAMGALAWQAGWREPGAGHRMVAITLWIIPLLFIGFAMTSTYGFIVRFIAAIPILVLALMLLTATLLRRRRALEAEVARRRLAESELLSLNASLEKTIEERTAQLVEREKLASLGVLVAGVAHELNTPLGNAIITVSALQHFIQEMHAEIAQGVLRRSQLTGFIQHSTEASELIERNLRRAADLVSSFKLVAVDQSSMRRRSFVLAEVVHDTLQTVLPLYKKLPVAIDVDVPKEITLDSFPGPLEQVLTNIISNAVLHALGDHAHLQIRISAHTCEFDGRPAVRLCVSDDGLGMTADVARHAFDPFFTTRLGQGGSGLGLYLVYNLVTSALGGCLTLETEPGQGSRFEMLLPLRATVAAKT